MLSVPLQDTKWAIPPTAAASTPAEPLSPKFINMNEASELSDVCFMNNSILALTLAARVATEIGYQAFIRKVSNHPTIQGISESKEWIDMIGTCTGTSVPSLTQSIDTGRNPPCTSTILFHPS